MDFISIADAKRKTGLSYLGSINSSSKIEKNKKVDVNTYILYLAPANQSGYEVCPFASKECREGCLASSGRNRMEILAGKNRISRARVIKTRLFFEQRNFFMDWLIKEIEYAKAKTKKDGMFFSVRLNGTSDIDWVNTYHNGKNIFEIFPDVQFYDYTKNPRKFNNVPSNYHLTFSYTGLNITESKALLKQGFNVAVVFSDENFPKTFMGKPVINGDETDFRPNDKKGSIVGLAFKKIADKQKAEELINKNRFVVRTF